MKRAKCPKCGKSVMKSEKFGDLYDRKKTSKRDKRDIGSLGFSFSGNLKQHKCR
jgi:hypothetical protein